jgi:hypothetical protein
MSERSDRTKKGVALAGGAFLAWLLIRGGGGRGVGRGVVSGRAGPPVKIRISDDGIRLDGVPASQARAVELAVAAGGAEVTATGAARSGTVTDLLAALKVAGVDVRVSGALQSFRNGALTYRRVGARGEDYPAWLRSLRGRSGVYVIRDARTGEILYVGESHTGRLYETLTRHFQEWRRWKGFWRGQYGEGHDPGLTYPRDRVEVAVRVTAPSDAIAHEARLIRRLAPRDNLLGQAEHDEVPF